MSGFEYLGTQVKKSVRTDFLRAFGNLGSQERPLYEEEARERQLAQLKQNAEETVKEKVPEREKGQARDQAGEARERQAQNALNNQPQSQKVEKIPPSEKGKARDQAGEARERQAQAGASAAPGRKAPEKIPEVKKGDSRDKAAEAVGATLPRWHLTAGARAGGASS